MTTGNISDRRQFAQELLAAMAEQSSAERDEGLRRIAASVLGFIPVEGVIVAPEHPLLPPTATVMASLPNRYGPDYIALHFDLPTRDGARTRSYVTNAQVQAANGVAQRYAGEERYPLLVFTLPDGSGVQFVTGNPEPGNAYRLQDVARVSAYWNGQNRTALDCLERVGYAIANGSVPQRAFGDAFDVQPVTSEFFADYKAVYDTAVGRITPSIGQADAGQFTQTLFNRLLFVHFVSRKGWLRFNGDTDYLNALWRDYGTGLGDGNFYRDRLSLLFFSGLNNPDSRNWTEGLRTVIGEVPFLNGGLFEQAPLDDRAAAGEFAVPDEIIEHVITGLFNRYNFTVMEATPLDTEVAVDPEMLGKLFEETVNERHSHGAYYTPRPVVAFMCREAIKGYLAGRNIAGLDTASIADLVDNANPQAVTVAQALEVASTVKDMKAVDPACGSGAFLLGMLQEILAVNETIFAAAKQDPDSLYRQKLDIISNNIYGADKDGLAVSTAMLRLWLSLAVDYEGEGTPDPLPNLDLKLVAGDTIAGPDPQQLDLTLHGIASSGLREDIAAYTTAQGHRKAMLRDKVESTKRELRDNMNDAAPEGVVEWRIDFADVMLNGGFDMVIANPPYVQLQANGGELANLYRNNGYATFARTGDLYQLFYERGCQLLRPQQGILAYITSNSWLKAEYGKATRRYFAENHTPLLLLELGKDVFESAIVDSSILMLQTGDSARSFPAVDMDRVGTADIPPTPELWGQTRPDGDAPWSILSATEQSIMDKMLAEGTPLKDWDVSVCRGVITGYNKAFIIDDAIRQRLIDADPKSEEIIKPILRGRDIQRYQAQWAGLWLIVVKFGSYTTLPEEFPAIYQHLLQHEDKLKARGQCRYTRSGSKNADYPGQHHWLELDNNPKDSYLEEFAKEKLLWIELVEDGRFAYDSSGIYGEATTFVMTGASLKYLCAVLNSTLIRWFLNQIAPTSGMGTLRWKKVYVETIPIPKLSAAKQRPFVRLVERILEAKADDPDADTKPLEWEIDRLVYELYGLTEAEDTAVERALDLVHQTDEAEEAALLMAMEEDDINDRVSLDGVLGILRAPDEC